MVSLLHARNSACCLHVSACMCWLKHTEAPKPWLQCLSIIAFGCACDCSVNIEKIAKEQGRASNAVIDSLERQCMQAKPKPRPLASFIKELSAQSRAKRMAAAHDDVADTSDVGTGGDSDS